MGYRNIFVANTAKLSAKNEQLIVDNGEVFSFPIEDVRCVLVEDNKTTLSAVLISKFAEAGVALIICNNKHLPTAVLNPVNTYSRQLRQIKLQNSATLPFKKNLWQQIVKSKITNQARCLAICGSKNAQALKAMANQVKSGDTANVEGRAASLYFKSLFGNNFKRGADTPVNAALDYGYAIIRAVICRTLCLYGFETSLGIHHCSELNNFNLADDIIEPFRPVVDLYVKQHLFSTEEFSTGDKALLLNIINASISLNNKNYSIANAIETVIQNYSDCLKNGKPALTLPQLIKIDFVNYE